LGFFYASVSKGRSAISYFPEFLLILGTFYRPVSFGRSAIVFICDGLVSLMGKHGGYNHVTYTGARTLVISIS